MRLIISLFLLLVISLAVNGQESKDAYAIGVKGIELIDQGDFEEGIKLLKQARNMEPQDYDYTFEIGKAYLKSGNPKRAEKYLFPLQYHVNAQSDLYIALANCYAELETDKKTPDENRKKELDALRYGIQKLPKEGVLYLELGKRKLEMEEPVEALVVLEKGIANAPNFAENYFWASKLLKATGNELWAWLYAELCFNMSDDEELLRSAAVLTSSSSKAVFSGKWKADPEKMDQDVRFAIEEKCKNISDEDALNREARACLMKNWKFGSAAVAPLFHRVLDLEKRGLLEAYFASIDQDIGKEKFLKWLANNGESYEAYRSWRFWNPLNLEEPIYRLKTY